MVQFSPEKLQAGGGSGFGLFITKSIVDLHEGTIGVYSAGEGKGTRFTLELPMSRINHPHSLPSLSDRFDRVQGNGGANINNGNNSLRGRRLSGSNHPIHIPPRSRRNSNYSPTGGTGGPGAGGTGGAGGNALSMRLPSPSNRIPVGQSFELPSDRKGGTSSPKFVDSGSSPRGEASSPKSDAAMSTSSRRTPAVRKGSHMLREIAKEVYYNTPINTLR